MLVYWLMFLYFAVGAMLEQPRAPATTRADVLFRLGIVLMAVVIGLRYKVGSDWYAYELMFSDARSETFASLPGTVDPGYFLVNVVVQQIDGQMWMVNLICAAIFCWGLMRFAEAQTRPWLATVVAIPYLVIVVAQGYTRQGVAIGIVMAGLAQYFNKGSIVRFAAYVAAASMFHKTAVVALPLVAVANDRGRWSTGLMGIALSYFLYTQFLSSSVGRFVTNYIDARYAAEGAGIRVAMCLVPAVLFLFRSRHLDLTGLEKRVWRNFSFAAFACLGLLFAFGSNAAVDRLALYVIPLQLAILSRPRSLFATEGFGMAIAILYSGAVQFTWLTYAHHARYWLPYDFWPFGG